MKKQNMVWLGTLSFFTLLIAAFFSFSSASAENVSLWTGSGDITKTLVASDLQSNSPYFDANCTRQSAEELAYHASVSGWLPNGYAPVQGYCWQNAAFGTYSQGVYGQYLRFGTFGAVTRVDLSNQLIPIGNKLAMKYNNGSSYFSGLSVFDIPQKQFKLRAATTYGGVRDQYIIDASTNPLWTLNNPQTSNALSINAVGTSNNGRWMVIEAGQSFIRLNVETKEILAFENPLYGYGGGTNPSFGLAISNDGRYTIIYGGGVNPQLFTVYDLSTCAPNPDNTMQTSVGCGKKDLRPSVFPGVSAYAGPSDVSFSDSAENISFNFNEAGKTNHYTITAPGHDQHLLQYLALGDSFSSGEGDGDGTWHYKAGTDGNGQTVFNTGINGFPYSSEKCHVSDRSYPYLLASLASLSGSLFKSMTCSGADANDILNIRSDGKKWEIYNGHFDQMQDISSLEQRIGVKQTALENFIPGREAQIKFLEKYKPVVATIGIGGNDINFSDKIKSCIAFASDSCEHASTERWKTGLEISSLYGSLKGMYSQLRLASPTTRLYAVGYPQLITSGGSCGVNVRLNQQEQEYAVFVVDYLNRTVKAAAAAAGISYLDIEDSLAGTNLCSSWAEPSVNGLTKGSDIGTLGINVIGNESYHPNERGHALMAAAIRTALSNEAINVHNPCASSIDVNCAASSPDQPPVPAYFGTTGVPTPSVSKSFFNTVNSITSGDVVVMAENAVDLYVDYGDTSAPLKAFTDVIVTLHSTPTPLGTFQTDAEGHVTTNITIPDGVEPGYHTVTMKATLVSGDTVEFYQPLLVLASLTDGDGDGIADDVDPCPFVDPSGIDIDHDGIDDACDGYINSEVDSIAPTVTATTVQLAGIDGWYHQDVTIHWAAVDTDPSSGIVALPTDTVATQEGAHDYSSPEVCDVAGNCTIGTINLKIDKTAPTLGSLVWTQNPKPSSGMTSVSVPVSDTVSGIVGGEYFIGETDPGVGNGATMAVGSSSLSTTFGADFPTGVYKISVRAKDAAGNWSNITSDYLVVYNPSSDLRISGQHTIAPSLEQGDILPGLISIAQKDDAKFAFSVSYDKHGQISRGSDMQFNFKTGSHCDNYKKATNCHAFDLNATSISWMTVQGFDSSTGIFQGLAKLKIDKALQQVQFRVTVVDGSHLVPKAKDQLALQIYAIDTDPNTAEPLYQVGSSQIKKGNIKISDFNKRF